MIAPAGVAAQAPLQHLAHLTRYKRKPPPFGLGVHAQASIFLALVTLATSPQASP